MNNFLLILILCWNLALAITVWAFFLGPKGVKDCAAVGLLLIGMFIKAQVCQFVGEGHQNFLAG